MSDKQLGPPTPAIERSLKKAQACCSNNLNAIEWYEEMAKVTPEIDPSVVELRLKHEHLDRMSRVGLRQVSANTSKDMREIMDAINPILPSDETPLNLSGVSQVTPQVLANIPIIKNDIDNTRQSIIDDMRGEIAGLSQQYDEARKDVVGDLLSGVATVEGDIVGHYANSMKAIDKQLGKIVDDYDNQYADMHVAGVSTPNGMEQIANDLTDLSGESFINRFTGASDNTAQDVVDGNKVTLADGTELVCPIGTVPVYHADHVSGIPGWYCDAVETDSNSNSPPVSPPPPTIPPTVPPVVNPPITSPVVPPTVPPVSPPIVGTINACDADNLDTVQIDCYQLPPEQIKLKYYVVLDCTDCRSPKACVFVGVRPPTNYTGILQSVVYGEKPSVETLKQLVVNCVKQMTGSDPTSPPTSPPIATDDTVDDTTASQPVACAEEYQDVIGDDMVNATIENCSVTASQNADGSQRENIETLNWERVKTCKDFHDSYINRLETSTNRSVQGKPISDSDRLKSIIGGFVSSIPGLGFFAPLYAQLQPAEARAGLLDFGGNILDTGVDMIASAIYSLPSSSVPNKRAASLIGGTLALGDRVQRITGFPLDYVMTGERYNYQYANPQFIPSQAELNSMYMTTYLSQTEWECYTKANGNLPILAAAARDSGEVKPNVNDLISLWQRGHIPDVAMLNARMRAAGVLNDVYKEEFQLLANATPQFDDVIRMMVRDAFDPVAVEKYGMDLEFPEKYTKDAEKLGKAIGLTDDIAKLYWRVHWHTPSDTALYTMVHQLNPNRPEVIEWDRYAESTTEGLATRVKGPRPQTFSTEDLSYALKINDNLPTFVDKLVAIQYRPITNTDASRMFELGYTSEDQFKWAIVKNGYTEKDSDGLVGFYKAQRTKRLSNDTGVWTGRKILTAFKEGLLNWSDTDKLLAEKIVDPAIRRSTMEGALGERDVETKRVVIKSLKKKYLYGQYDDEQLKIWLEASDIDRDSIDAIITRWQAEKAGRGREPRVAELCKWFNTGILAYNDYVLRLELMGFERLDIDRIVGTCANENAAKQQKLAAAQAEKQRRETERLLRAQRADLAETLKKLQANIKAAEQRYADILAAVGFAS